MPRSKLNRQRHVLAKLMIELMRGVWDFPYDNRFGVHAEEILVALAVLVGHIERKPLGASKIGEFVGIPRASVARKLKALERLGIVESNANGLYTIAPHLMGPGRAENTQRLVALVERAAKDLAALTAWLFGIVLRVAQEVSALCA